MWQWHHLLSLHGTAASSLCLAEVICTQSLHVSPCLYSRHLSTLSHTGPPDLGTRQHNSDALAALSLSCMQVLVQEQLYPPPNSIRKNGKGLHPHCEPRQPCTTAEQRTTRSETTRYIPLTPTCSRAWQPQPSPGLGPRCCAAQVSFHSLQSRSPGARG